MKSESKVVLLSSIVLFLIIVSGILIKSYLDVTTAKFITELDTLERYINTDQWDKAREMVIDLNGKWEKTENIWTLFTNHHEIDNISISLKTLGEYIVGQDKTESKASLVSLKHFISHIPKMEKLSLKNIF